MNNKSKCYFSIRLEKSGIIITGDDAEHVNSYLSELQLCISDAIRSKFNDNYPAWKRKCETMREEIIDAWETIFTNQIKEEE